MACDWQETIRHFFARAALSLLVTLLIVVSTLGLVSGGQPDASANDDPPPPSPVSVNITLITPATLSPDVPVVISGTITNTTSAPLSGLKVALWAESTPIRSMQQFRAALASGPESIAWQPYADPGAAIDNLDAVAGALAPGESTTFSVTGRVAGENSLELQPGAAYAIGVQVWQADGSWYLPVGEERLLVTFPESPVSSSEPDEPEPENEIISRPQAVSVVALTSAPSLIEPSIPGAEPSPALFSDDHLAAELTGRLATLLSYASNSGVTVVVDPALYDAVLEMTRGYAVRHLGGSNTTGVGVQSAVEWLASLNKILADRTRSIYRGLYGTPDLAWTCSNAAPEVLSLSAEALPATHPLSRLPTAALATFGRSTTNIVECLDPYQPLTLLLDSLDDTFTVQTSADADSPNTASVTSIAVSNDIVSESDATSANTGNPDANALAWRDGKSALQVNSALLAMRYVWALNGQPLVSLADTVTEARTLAMADLSSELIHLETLESRSQSPVIWRVGTPANAFLPEDLPSLTEVAGTRFNYWLSITNNTQYVADYKKHLLTGTWSSEWKAVDSAALTWLDAGYAPVLTNLTGTISISGSPEWHISPETTQLPIQVSNTTNVSVRVHVEFSSENEQRLRVPASADIEIRPGETVTVRVSPRAEANGSITVTAWVATRDGLQVSDSRSFVVSVSSAGRLAWLIIAASGVGFLGLTAWRVFDVRKHGKGDKRIHGSLALRLMRTIGRDPGVDDDANTE